MGFNPANYEDVDSRIHRFYDKHPEGRIETEVVQTPGQSWQRDDGATLTAGSWVVKAYVYRDSKAERPAGTGFAEEVPGSSNVNRTSALENCETSAVGRALANAGYSPKGQRASRQEMEKAERSSGAARPSQSTPKTEQREVAPAPVGGSASAEPKAEAFPPAASPRDGGKGVVVGGEVSGDLPPATDLINAHGRNKVLMAARNLAKANGQEQPTDPEEIDGELLALVAKHFERVDA